MLGATGGIGQEVVRQGSLRGHKMTAVIREGGKGVSIEGVNYIIGNPLLPGTLKKALGGQEVVISCLGLRRKNPRNPWSKLLSPPNLTSRAIELLVPMMKKSGLKRIVAISAGGVGESASQVTRLIQKLITSGQIAVAYEDLERMESALLGSGLDWMAVRPVTLRNGPPTGKARLVESYGLFSTIRRSDVAQWILDAVENEEPFRRRHVLLG